VDSALLRSPEQTHALGRRLGGVAHPGCVIALVGDLGVGKTVLAQGIGQGLGVPGLVTSPSFVLMVEHLGGRLPMIHADLYRLNSEEEAEAIGYDEALRGDGVAVVEWADRLAGLLPRDHLRIELRWLQGGAPGREVWMSGTGPRHAPLVALLHD